MTDSVIMADEAAVVEAGSSESPLVAVTFQRNIHRKEKYLEAEPKALGITQIGLSLFQIICVSVFVAKDLSSFEEEIPFYIASLLVVIAGSVAIAAQNLHLPTLRGCLGMQIVACGASCFNIIYTLVKVDSMVPYICWHYDYDNSSAHNSEICHMIESTHSHFQAEGAIIEALLLAISAALVAYCCKVVNCCSPAPKMPVITVHTTAVQQ
ncbi:uncharacterized protein LOC128384330 [Scomber japonicus]|uniref:uncharacterized protein LOC128384330 n=1 Tax=Scomber japonicus TaxID=13676 RepID=UPI002305FC41|nr:uncharacterized protein LOC128384330 [Scomber japonicus]